MHREVIYAKMLEIETQNPDLLNHFKDIPFTRPGIFGSLDLTVGKLRLLSGRELDGIAKKLSPSACRLLSDNQVLTIDFQRFSGEQLDEMIASNGNDNEISRRLGLLSVHQIQIYLKKSSGCHFTKFPDSFYQKLPLSRLNTKQVKALFDDDYGMKKAEATHRIQLVSPQEISNGFHLLSGDHARMLSDTQVSFLDYSLMNEKQVKDLFESYHYRDKKELERRVQLILERFINDVIKTNSCILKFLSLSQYRALNVDLLDQEAVRDVFPGFTLDTLHPGYTYTVRDGGHFGVRHEFELGDEGSCNMSGYSKQELDDKLHKNKTQCIAMACNFTSVQLHVMTPFMYPECLELVEKKVTDNYKF